MDKNDKNCVYVEICPLQKTLDLISGKWKLLILYSLYCEGATRYNSLKRKIKGISNTMLVKSLKELEQGGLLNRQEYIEVPIRVEYKLTDLGNELISILHKLNSWGNNLKD